MRTSISRRELLRLFAAATTLAAATGCGGAATPTAVAEKAKTSAAGAHDPAHEAEAKKWWAASGGDVILKSKTFQALFDGLANKMAAFKLKDTYLRCIDEG